MKVEKDNNTDQRPPTEETSTGKPTIPTQPRKPWGLTTTKKKKLFLKGFFQAVGNISSLCKKVGISRDTYYYWMENDPKFKKETKMQEEALKDWAESQQFILMQNLDGPSIRHYLNAKAKDRGYGEEKETLVDLKVLNTSKIEIVHTRVENPEMFEQILKELQNANGSSGDLDE